MYEDRRTEIVEEILVLLGFPPESIEKSEFYIEAREVERSYMKRFHRLAELSCEELSQLRLELKES